MEIRHQQTWRPAHCVDQYLVTLLVVQPSVNGFTGGHLSIIRKAMLSMVGIKPLCAQVDADGWRVWRVWTLPLAICEVEKWNGSHTELAGWLLVTWLAQQPLVCCCSCVEYTPLSTPTERHPLVSRQQSTWSIDGSWVKHPTWPRGMQPAHQPVQRQYQTHLSNEEMAKQIEGSSFHYKRWMCCLVGRPGFTLSGIAL